MTDIASGLRKHAVNGVEPKPDRQCMHLQRNTADGSLATLVRANELLSEWIGYRLGSGQEINLAELQAEWEAAKVRAKKENAHG